MKRMPTTRNMEKSYLEVINLKNNYKNILLELWTISKIYIFWILVHYISSNLYSHFCTHLSFLGLIMSPIMTISPHCKVFHWFTVNSILNINNMWVAITGWILLKIKTE